MKRYYVCICFETSGSQTWDVIDRVGEVVVANHRTRREARADARERNRASSGGSWRA